RGDLDSHFCQQQRVAKRNQFVGPLSCHDASNTRGAEDIAFLGVASGNHRQRFWFHDHGAFGNSGTNRVVLVTHVDHVGFAGRIKMSETVAGHGQLVPFSNARVAAVTSRWRIRLSPTRKVEIPDAFSRLQSSWVKMPLSPTMMRSDGTIFARRSDVSRLTSNVRKLRLLMPISGDARWVSARSISVSSWTSTRTSMPASNASSSSSFASSSVRLAMITRIASAPQL